MMIVIILLKHGIRHYFHSTLEDFMFKVSTFLLNIEILTTTSGKRLVSTNVQFPQTSSFHKRLVFTNVQFPLTSSFHKRLVFTNVQFPQTASNFTLYNYEHRYPHIERLYLDLVNLKECTSIQAWLTRKMLSSSYLPKFF